MDCSMPGFPVLHHLSELAQTMSIESVMPSNHLVLCPLFSCFQCFLASGSFLTSWLFASGGQSIGASVLPMYYFGINLSKSTGENLGLVSCPGGSFSESAKFQQHSLQRTLSSYLQGFLFVTLSSLWRKALLLSATLYRVVSEHFFLSGSPAVCVCVVGDHQLGVLQLSALLMLSPWRWHQISQAKGSVPLRLSPAPHYPRSSWQSEVQVSPAFLTNWL